MPKSVSGNGRRNGKVNRSKSEEQAATPEGDGLSPAPGPAPNLGELLFQQQSLQRNTDVLVEMMRVSNQLAEVLVRSKLDRSKMGRDLRLLGRQQRGRLGFSDVGSHLWASWAYQTGAEGYARNQVKDMYIGDFRRRLRDFGLFQRGRGTEILNDEPGR